MTRKERYIESLRRSKDFIKGGIWEVEIDNLSRFKAKVVKYLRIIILAAKNHSNQGIGWKSVALSFFTMMAFVPFIAVIFAIANYMGLGEYLMELIYKNFGHTEIMDYLMTFANNIINSSKEGIYGIISFLVFGWMVIWLMICVERSFNNIWKIRKSRVLYRRVIYYIITLLTAPLVILITLSVSLTIADGINIIGISIPILESVSGLLVWTIFGIFMALGLTIVYILIPNTKVRFMPALASALISSFAFTIVQYLYLETQVFVSRMNAVYGVFAAIPLFMIWLNIGWFIILFGSNLSYSFQNIDNYPLEDLN